MVKAKNKKYHIALYAYGGYLALNGLILLAVAGIFGAVFNEVLADTDELNADLFLALPGILSKYTLAYLLIGVLFIVGGFQLQKLKEVSIVLVRIAVVLFVIQLIYFMITDYHLIFEALPQLPENEAGLAFDFDEMIWFSSAISLLTQLAPAVLIFIFINPKYLAEQRALEESEQPPIFEKG